LLRGAYWTGGDQIDAGWVPGTALIARRAAVEQVGLMDPRYFLYGEDLDWCWRMRRSGWSIGVCSSTRAVHRESSSAHRSFASGDVLERIARGEVAAVERMRGRLAGRLYAAAVAFGLLVEAHHPRRSAEQRARARRGAHIWWSTCAQI